MNKIKILSLAALCVGFVACDEVEESLSQPQTHPQDPIFKAEQLAVSTPDGNFNLQQLNDNNQPALVSNFTVNDFPSNLYSLQLVAQLSEDDSFATSYEVPTTLDSLGHVNISADAIQGVYYANISKNPVETTMHVRYIANAVNGSEKVRIGGPDVFFGQGKFTFMPFNPTEVIEPAYYLVGTVSGGSIAKAVKFSHSDINQYDDPIFSVSVEISPEQAAAGYEWYIIPASTFASGTITADGTAYGPTTDDINALAGSLSGTVTDGMPNVGIVKDTGPHLFTINMEQKTFDIALAVSAIYAYTSSPTNGYMLTTNDYINYQGFAGMRQAYFMLSELNNTSSIIRWGQAMDENGEPIEGKIEKQTPETVTPIYVPNAGCYFLNVNIVALTYSAQAIEYFELIGGWDPEWGKPIKMVKTDRNYMIWEGELTITDGTEFKIRTNGNWDGANLGCPYGDQSNFGNLVEHGENMIWNLGDGTFKVTLDLTSVPYKLTAVKI